MWDFSRFVNKVTFGATCASLALASGISCAHAENMTAGTIMKEMGTRERSTYIMGLVDGMAYARFRSDTAKASQKSEAGMNCIIDTLYKDMTAGLDRIEAAFEKYPDYLPSTVVGAIMKKECGE